MAFLVEHACGPELSSSGINRGNEAEHRLLAESSLVVDIHAADHRGLVSHERESINSPWDATNLGVDLDEDLRDDGAHVLALGDSSSENDLGRNRHFREEESLDVIVESALAFLAREKHDAGLDSRLDLVLDFLLPGVDPVALRNREHPCRVSLVAELLQALVHGRLELLGDLLVSVRVEDGPHVEVRLSVHAVLDLPVDLSASSLDVEGVSLTVALLTHQQVSRGELVAFKMIGLLLELELPLLHLLLALRVLLEHFEKVLALGDLALSVSVSDLSQVLHQSEVSSHRIGQASECAELRDEERLSSSLPIFVHEERLLHVLDGLLVLSLEVVLEAHLLLSLGEG